MRKEAAGAVPPAVLTPHMPAGGFVSAFPAQGLEGKRTSRARDLGLKAWRAGGLREGRTPVAIVTILNFDWLLSIIDS